MESFHSYRGFTLIEMLVVLAVIISLTGIVFSGQGSFNKSIILTNTAYDIALSIRSAETYGLGGRAISTLATGYGIHFAKATPINSYMLFADSSPLPSTTSVCHPTSDVASLDAQPGDCSYGVGDVLVTNYTLGNGLTISDFCAQVSNSWLCANGNGGTLSSLDIVFSRPNLVPLMTANGMYATGGVTKACIVVTSPQGGLRYVTVSPSGAINPNDTPCP